MRRPALALALVLVSFDPAGAMVGAAPEIVTSEPQPETMLVGSGGNFCTGALIAPDLILTAGHCIAPNTDYKTAEAGPDRRPVFKDIVSVARHPQFSLKTLLAHRATADVALLKLAAPSNGRLAPLLPPRPRVAVGENFTVRGYGVAVRGEGNSAGRLRAATLVATGQPGNLQLRLADPASD